MLRFIWRKMVSNKWMIFSLLIGNILLISMVASIPLYSDAILQRMLQKQFEQRQLEVGRYPAASEFRFSSLSISPGGELRVLGTFEQMIAQLETEIDVPIAQKVTIYSTVPNDTRPLTDRASTVDTRLLRLLFMSDLQDHIKITGGRMYSNTVDSDGCVEVIVSERTLVEQDLLLGEILDMRAAEMPDGSSTRLRVVGVFENSMENDIYWREAPSTFSDACIMDEALFRSLYIDDYRASFNFTGTWFVMFDYMQMKTAAVGNIIESSRASLDQFSRYGTQAGRVDFVSILQGFEIESQRLGITLWVLQVPIFILLAFFIFMVSKQILEQEKNTIAVIKSRGASRAQVILVFLGQSLIITAVSYGIGIVLGTLICRVLGASDGFLGLVQRASLDVELNAEAFMYAAAAGLLSVLTMVVPAFSYSKTTIVDHKRSSSVNKRPLWQKLFVDIILLGVAIYGCYSFNAQRGVLAASAAIPVDPLLFISSSLFVIGAGLLFVRIFPAIVKGIFFVGRKRWSPSLYASFLKVTRSTGSEQFIMIFLVLTIATGIFNAKAARTINQNMEDNIRYSYGADIVLSENFKTNRSAGSMDTSSGNAPKVYFEPDFEKYQQLSAFSQYTKVQDTLNLTESSIGSGVRLLGIDTRQFGEIAWMRDGLTPVHWYNYLNAMASDARAVLVSSNFKTVNGYSLGDNISLRNPDGNYFSGIICGFVDFFPTFHMTTDTVGKDGNVTTTQNYLVIANLAQVQSVWGVMPYSVWISTDDPYAVYDFAEANNLKFQTFSDSNASIIAEKNDPVLQGTNGVLTVGFIIILIVCMTGFLIYWILSIRARTLQFGVFRAMGMTMRSVLNMLVCEQILISGTSIAAGAGIGILASELFVPLIQLGFAAGQTVLPLQIVAEGSDYVRLFTVTGIMLVVCMVVLGRLIARIKIAQALKLGED